MPKAITAKKPEIEIRPFETSDYSAVIAIRNEVFHEYPMTAQELQVIDERRAPKYLFQRFVAALDGSIAGYADYDQIPFMYHPQRFDIGCCVMPKTRNQGIGTALYQRLLQALKPFDPLTLRCQAREDFGQTLRFIHKRNFQESMREWESRLDLGTFNFSRYKGHIERVESSGIKLAPLSQIPRSPENDRKLYDLSMLLESDVPQPDPFTPVDYNSFVERCFGHPGYFSEAFYLALDGSQYVGMSGLWKSQANRDIYTGLTGVHRDYRRRGIALALKLKCLAVAKAEGYSLIKTWNASHNRAMLSINEDMGFVKQPAWIRFAKELSPKDF